MLEPDKDFLIKLAHTKMPFGKYAGKEIIQIPAHYREWMLDNFKWTPFNQKIKDEILRLKNIGI